MVQVSQLGDPLNICDANSNLINMEGNADLSVVLGAHLVFIFNHLREYTESLTLGTELCDRFFISICEKRNGVELKAVRYTAPKCIVLQIYVPSWYRLS